MTIEQLHFTRTDGDSSGWKFVNITDGVTEEMKQAFQSIHTHTPTNTDMYSLDLVNGKYYLSKSTCTGTDSLGRTKCFIHGVSFSSNDYIEVFKNYNALLGFENFDTDENSSISKNISLANCSYDIDITEQVDLRKLLECVFEAVLLKKTLYIVDENNLGDEMVKAIMNVIYSYIPLYLRAFISFSSCSNALQRKLMLVSSEENARELIYNFNKKSSIGCNNEYEEFVSLLIMDKDRYIRLFDKFVNESNVGFNFSEEVCKNAINYINMQSSKFEDLSDDEVVSKLTDILFEENYYDKSTISYMIMLLNKIVDKKTPVSSTVHSMIVDVYPKTNNEELRDSISKYMGYTYSIKCSDSDYESLKAIKYDHAVLAKNISIYAIKAGATELIKHYANDALYNPSVCTYVTDELGEECTKIVAECMAEILYSDKNSSNILRNIMSTSMHIPIINEIEKYPNNHETVIAYINDIFSVKNIYESYKTNAKKSVQAYILNYICTNITEKRELGIPLMEKIYSIDKECYRYVESNLINFNKQKFVDEFYSQILLERCFLPEDILKLTKKYIKLFSGNYGFIELADSKLKDLCLNEKKNVNTISSWIKVYSDFANLIGAPSTSFIDQIKENYWHSFDYKSWNPDIRYDDLMIDTNKCRTVKLLSDVANQLKNHKPDINEEWTQSLIRLLSENNQYIRSQKEREGIIHKLQNVYKYGEHREKLKGINISFDLFLLLNCLNIKKATEYIVFSREEDSFCEYIDECSKQNGYGLHMINDPKVFIDVYETIYKYKNNSKTLKKLDELVTRFNNKDKEMVENRISKITEVPDYTWISSICMMATIASIFKLIGFLNLGGITSFVLRALLVIMGCVLVFFDAKMDSEYRQTMFEPQLVSGEALFISFLLVISVL